MGPWATVVSGVAAAAAGVVLAAMGQVLELTQGRHHRQCSRQEVGLAWAVAGVLVGAVVVPAGVVGVAHRGELIGGAVRKGGSGSALGAQARGVRALLWASPGDGLSKTPGAAGVVREVGPTMAGADLCLFLRPFHSLSRVFVALGKELSVDGAR